MNGVLSELGINNIGIFITFSSFVISNLPVSPFKFVIAAIDDIPWLQYMNYFLPVAEMVAILELWLLAITMYYIIMPLARWIKLIQ